MTDTATEPSANGTTTANPNAWTIKWLDYTWHSTEITTQQLCSVSETLGVWDWSVARPDSGPRQLVTWIATLWSAEVKDQSVEESLALVLRQPLSFVVNALTTGA